MVSTLAVVGSIYAAYLSNRRTASGRVGTSNAEVLWQQSQAMYEAVLRERDDARAQRDKLMSAQADQVIPILSAVLQAVQQMGVILKEIDSRSARSDEILQALNAKWGNRNAVR